MKSYLPLSGVLVLSLCSTPFARGAVEDLPAPSLLPMATDEVVPGVPAPLERVEEIRMAEDPAPVAALPLRVAVMNAVVTLDGQPRPDLGQAFSDTLVEKLLKRTDLEVLDLDIAALMAPPADAAAPAGALLLPGMPTEADRGKVATSDYTIVPTVIGTGRTWRLTLKKLVSGTGKVEAIVRDTATGNADAFYTMAGNAASKLFAVKDTSPPITYVKMWMNNPGPPLPPPTADVEAPRALGSGDPIPADKLAAIEAAKRAAYRTAALDHEPERSGRIAQVEQQWSFCIFTSDNAAGFQAGDRVFTWNERNPGVVIDLKVSRIEGRRVIADFAQGRGASIQAGDSVYRWRPGAQPAAR